MCRWNRSIEWLACIGVLACLLSSRASAQVADSDASLSRFLQRLELHDLEIFHLEQILSQSAADPIRQRALAGRLADLYARKLMAVAGQADQFQHWMERVERLKERFPQANTPSLQVMLLQAEFQRLEPDLPRWPGDQRQQRESLQALAALGRIAPQLEKLHQTLLQQATGQQEQAAATDPQPDAAVGREVLDLQASAARAAYFAAWSWCYLAEGAAVGSPEAGQAGGQAARLFRHLLDLDPDEPLERVSPQWLSLQSVPQARALIGLALAEGHRNLADARRCLAWLQTLPVPPAVRQELPYWSVRILLADPSLQPAIQEAQRWIRQLHPPASAGTMRLCGLLVTRGVEGMGRGEEAAEQLLLCGLRGLVRLGQTGALAHILPESPRWLSAQERPMGLWLSAARAFHRAQQSGNRQDYSAAAQSLRAVLQSGDLSDAPELAAWATYALAFSLYHTEQWEEAAQQFRFAAQQLQESGVPDPADALWMAAVATYQTAKNDPPKLQAVMALLQQLQRDYPEHRNAGDAQRLLWQIAAHSDPSRLLDQLGQIPADDPRYADALYQLCLVQYQRWQQAPASSRQRLLAALQESVEKYWALPPEKTARQQRWKVALMLAQAVLDSQAQDVEQARRYLRQAEALGEPPSSEKDLQSWHYLSMEAARRSGDRQAVARHAQWLIRNAAGTPYESPALVQAIRLLEEDGRGEDSRQRATELLSLYERLATLVGTDPDTLRAKSNARVALFQAARYARQLGRVEQAARYLSLLIAAFPDHRPYVEEAASVFFQAQRYREALPLWTRLARAAEPGSEAWLQAKYHQLRCLAAVDRSQARAALQQLRLLYPNLPPPWPSRLDALAKELNE